MLIREISNSNTVAQSPYYDSAATQIALDGFVNSNIIYNYLHFFPISGNGEYVRRSSDPNIGSGDSAFRPLNTQWTNAATNPSYLDAQLSIFGGRYVLDQAHQRRGVDVVNLLERETRVLGRNAGWQFVDSLFNATASSAGFQGLKQYANANSSTAHVSFGAVLNSTNASTFFERLDQAIEEARGGFKIVVADGNVISRMANLRQNAFNYVTNDSSDLASISFNQRVLFYSGIPVIPAGYNTGGTRVLGLRENSAGAVGTTHTSVFVLSIGEMENFSIASNVGLAVTLAQEGANIVSTCELDAVPTVLDPHAVKRVIGIALS